MSATPTTSMQIAGLSLLLAAAAAFAADKDADQPPIARGPTDNSAMRAQEGERTQQNSSTFNEVTTDVQAKFIALDIDHDGTIDQNEASVSNILGSQFTALDTNGDGKLSLSEFAAASDLASIKTMNSSRDRE